MPSVRDWDACIISPSHWKWGRTWLWLWTGIVDGIICSRLDEQIISSWKSTRGNTCCLQLRNRNLDSRLWAGRSISCWQSHRGLGAIKSYVELTKNPSLAEISALESCVNEHIRANLAISVIEKGVFFVKLTVIDEGHGQERPDSLPDDLQGGIVRWIVIGDIDKNAYVWWHRSHYCNRCCGTHLRNTSEVQVCLEYLVNAPVL